MAKSGPGLQPIQHLPDTRVEVRTAAARTFGHGVLEVVVVDGLDAPRHGGGDIGPGRREWTAYACRTMKKGWTSVCGRSRRGYRPAT